MDAPDVWTAVPVRRRRRWPLVVGLAVAVVLGAGGALLAVSLASGGGKPAAGTMTVSGSLKLSTGQYVRQTADDRSPCSGYRGYDDIRAGASVVVTDAAGKTVGVGSLDSGYMVGAYPSPTSVCLLEFTIRGVPTGAKFYGVQVSHRGVVRYSESEVRSPLVLSIGG